MPISNESNKKLPQTNGLIKSFSFTFKFFQPSDIQVSFWAEGEAAFMLEEGVHYELIYTDPEEGGFIELIESSAEAQAQGAPKYPGTPEPGTLLIERVMPLDQQANIRPVSGFPEEVITNTFDKLVMIDQQQQEQLDRCIKVAGVSEIKPEALVAQVERIHEDIDSINLVADNMSKVKYVYENGEAVLNASEETLANVNDAREAAGEAKSYANASEETLNTCERYMNMSSMYMEEARSATYVTGRDVQLAAQHSEAAKAQAEIASQEAARITENIDTATEQAGVSIEQARIATEQAEVATNQASLSASHANESLLYSKNAKASEENALIYSNTSKTWANESQAHSTDSKVWAEGTDAEVQALGGLHSAKTWAELVGENNVDLTDYVKNTDYATSSKPGIIKVDLATGINADSTGKVYISKATDSLVTAKTNNYRPLVPSNIDLVVKTGITTNTIELTDEEKTNAKDWLGISESGGSGGFNLFDTKLSDHILDGDELKGWALQGTYVYKNAIAGSRDGYPDFYNKVIEEYNEAILTETVNGVTVKVNSNGHKFYDIADKTIIDELFNNTGLAWFYGIDTENERVFLPRNVWFEQMTGDTTQVGDFVNAGLPNIDGTFYVNATASESGTNGGGAFTVESMGGKQAPNGDDTSSFRFNFNASLSNPIYGNSDTVQPNAVKKLLYICVGNTNVETAVTEVVDVTTTENDTVPLFTGQYFDFKPNNLSWLKAGEQANSGDIYTTAYNELVNCLNGVNKYNLKVIDIADMVADVDYSEYWKVNQDEMYFVTPTKLSYGAFSEVASVVGNGIALTLTDNIRDYGLKFNTSGDSNRYNWYVNTGESINVGASVSNASSGTYDKAMGLSTDETKSGVEAHLKQSTAELYFKVANAVQNLELLNVGAVMEAVSDKISRQDCVAYITESFVDGTSGYNVYSNGYCEQWGRTYHTEDRQNKTITFLKKFVDTNYRFQATQIDGPEGNYSNGCNADTLTTTNLQFVNRTGGACYFSWEAKGYIE